MDVYIHSVIERSEVNGPGTRAVVWFAGCHLACEGCWNPELFVQKRAVPVSSLVDQLAGIEGITGVSFSGGEPTNQPCALLDTIRHLQDRRPELNYLLYTGRTMAELRRGRYAETDAHYAGWDEALASLWEDLEPLFQVIVAGRYVKSLRIYEPLRSSSNQELVFPQGPVPGLPTFQSAEWWVGEDGVVQMTGFPDSELLAVSRK